jgi:acetyl esterase/lipase
MRPTTAYDNVFNFEALLHPGTVFEAPGDVLKAEALTVSEKRAILASWASDASAIVSCPALRSPPALKTPVTIDEVLEALQALDERGPPEPPGGKPKRLKSVSRALAA